MGFALFTLAFVAGGCWASTTPAIKVELTPHDSLAVCLDGSPAVYYISKGTNPKGVYIYHQGGGWCQTEEECAQRAATPLGSSKTYLPTKDLRTAQTHVFMTRDAAVNPLMHDWTYIWLPYCDGGSFAGDAAGAQSQDEVVRAYESMMQTDVVQGPQLPQVGISSVWYDGNPCNMHLLQVSEVAKHEMEQLGMVPMRFNSIGVSDGISNGTDGTGLRGKVLGGATAH